MKKIFTLLAATALFAGVGFAQETTDPFPTDVTFSSPDGTIQTDSETGESYLSLSQMNTTVNLNLDKAPEIVGVIPVVTIYSGVAGFTEDFITLPVDPVNSNPIVVTLDSSMWGNPYLGNYYATIMLTYIDAEGDFVLRDDEPIIFQMACVTPNVLPAELKYTYPNNDWENETFAEAYENGVITFGFTNPVTFSNESNAVSIAYTVDGEDDERTLAKSDCVMDWNRLDGYYTVSFQYSTEDYTVEEISQIKITLNDVIYVPTSEGGVTPEPVPVTVNTVILTKPGANPAPRKQKSRMADELTNGNELVNVYNIQGMLVKESVKKSAINELPAGLYIVEGKKIVVR